MKFAADLYNKYSIMAVLVVMLIVGIASNYYHFYYLKDYNYVVRVACSADEIDCTFDECVDSDEQCEDKTKTGYKEKLIKAKDFNKCGNDCSVPCENSLLECSDLK